MISHRGGTGGGMILPSLSALLTHTLEGCAGVFTGPFLIEPRAQVSRLNGA
jgi:hypothetical protein